ncbi:methylated-DNA--[protein]-cysteine S-methyltransferase [Castellaniella defragrans]|uniref:Methylated-DNA--protein-cysteine methyltransferase n=1 Tax=Castellaniella defragrans TaxID=75697 RepID=A0A7W9TQV8_CASDE|nr:methylated-DNA--[protein]-cysteine S-methyltransferase [Castellaniella defragrans]KAB0610113.1 methylated-DNA--[protein]-cysteine S-methyltransferase [Castellaniella defragrans]MBB6084358.1 methylated-DNA-[protein]-cysteine S-methyltransferase [Castellaniella defragrans]
MPFHALIPSPLGPILLAADEAGLTGLYFTDQRDLPRVPGVEAAAAVVSDPTAGFQGNRAIRTFKATRERPTGASGELFPTGSAAASAPAPARRRDEGAADGPGTAASLRLLQEGTPAAVLAVLEQTRRELDEYWRGERTVFGMPLAPRGTAFQQKVWQALLEVPCGETLSYGELAERAGLGAGHGRAVGTAVGSNPISIIIPCHRILARNGTLNGYGGGLGRKVRLLEIEGFTIR